MAAEGIAKKCCVKLLFFVLFQLKFQKSLFIRYLWKMFNFIQDLVQHWSGIGLLTVRHQAITWIIVDQGLKWNKTLLFQILDPEILFLLSKNFMPGHILI